MTTSNPSKSGPRARLAYSRLPLVRMPTLSPFPRMASRHSADPGNGTASSTNSHSLSVHSSSISLSMEGNSPPRPWASSHSLIGYLGLLMASPKSISSKGIPCLSITSMSERPSFS